MRLVVGLGNPGKQYERTRHNVGFLVVDRCCARRGIEPTKKAHFSRCAFHGIGREQVCFAKPATFMNESGVAVRGFFDFYKLASEDILVVCDDMALPLGQLRIRAGGSSGGQKGLESIIRHLGTDRFPRLRVGIGARPEHMDGADYVLGRFAPEEQEAIAAAVDRAADAVDSWLEDGVEATQARFNVRKRSEGKEQEQGKKKIEGESRQEDKGGERAPGRDSPRLAGGPE